VITPDQVTAANRALWWINLFKPWALAMVVLGVAYEFAADRLERPHIQVLETAHEEEMAKLQLDLSKAQMRTAELWKQIQPRELTADQQKAIGNALRSFHGQKVTVFSYGWDQEGYGFSKQIVAALRFANLDVEDRSGKSIAPGVEQRGVIINWWLTENLARNIGDKLKSLGNVEEVTVREGKSTMVTSVGEILSPNPVLNIFIAPKPLAVLPPE
jgi:hypothetical protein